MTKQELLVQSEKPKLCQIMIQSLISHWWVSSNFQLFYYWTSSLLPYKFHKHFFFGSLTGILPLRKTCKQHSLTGSTWNRFHIFHPGFLEFYSWGKKKGIVLIYLQNHLRHAPKRQSSFRPPLSAPHWVSEKAPKHWSPDKNPDKIHHHKSILQKCSLWVSVRNEPGETAGDLTWPEDTAVRKKQQ